MAVPSSPPISFVNDVQAEFTANTPVPNSLVDALDAIFTPTRSEDSLLDFAETGQPSGGDVIFDTAGNLEADFEVNVLNTGGGDSVVASLQVECSRDSLFTGTIYQSSIVTESVNDVIYNIATVTGLEQGTEYYFRLRYWNGYCSGDPLGDFPGTTFTTDIAVPINLDRNQDSGGFNLSWDHSSFGVPPNGYTIDYRVNGGSWNFLTSTSGTSYTHDGCSTDYSNGDDVDHRIRSIGNDVNSSNVSFPGALNALCL